MALNNNMLALLKRIAPALFGVLLLTGNAAAQTPSAGPTLDPSMLPDTTYRVVVNRVIDSTHIAVTLSTGVRTLLTAGRPNMDFSHIRPGDSVMLSTEKGTVLVFKDLGPAPTSTP